MGCLPGAWPRVTAGRPTPTVTRWSRPTELFAYLKKAMPAAGAKGAQTPELFLPDDRPPRLSDEAKTLIRRLAGYADQVKVNLDAALQEYGVAQQAAGTEVEPRLVYGLVLLKKKDWEKATQHFEAIKSEMPNRLLPYAALAWLRMEKRAYAAAVLELAAMIGKIPGPAGPGKPQPVVTPEPYEWAGELREYAMGQHSPSRQLTEAVAALDAAVATRGTAATALYKKGRDHSARVLADFDKKIEEAEEVADRLTLETNRKLLANYLDFPINQYKEEVLSHLDE